MPERPSMHYSSNSKQYVLALTKQFLEEHNTCESTVNMTKAKPTYMENILVYEKHAKQPCYSLQWIIGYFISDYYDLRNSFIMWICDKLQLELQTHLESTNELLAEGTVSQINIPPITGNIDNSQSTSMLYQSFPEETNAISYEFLLQYYTNNEYLMYNSLLQQICKTLKLILPYIQLLPNWSVLQRITDISLRKLHLWSHCTGS